MQATSRGTSQALAAVLAQIVALAGLLLLSADISHAQAPQAPPALKRLQEEAADLYRRRQWPEALAASERLLAQTRTEFGAAHEQVAIQAYGLGLVAEAAGRLDVAERAFRENLAVGEKVYGRDSAATTQGMEKLAEVLVRAGRAAEAEPLLRRVLAIRSGLVGGDHSYNASTHAGLAAVSLARGNAQAALASYREAVRLLTGRRETQTLARHVMDNEVRRLVGAFAGLAEAAWQVAGRQPGERARLTDEAYRASQQAWTTAAGAALAGMAARLGAGEGELAGRIRRQQQAAERILTLHQEDMRELARWSEVQRQDAAYAALLEEFRQASLSQHRDNAPAIKRQHELVGQLQAQLARCPPGQKKAGCERAESERNAITRELSSLSAAASRGSGDLMAVHARMEAAEARLPGHAAFKAARKARLDESQYLEQVSTAERAAIVRSFPDYVALTDPEPLTLAATQALLRADEALVSVLVGPEQSFVWAITRERAEWARLAVGAAALGATVAALRLGLDPLTGPAASGAPSAAFDLERAHRLYADVLGPVAGVLEGKRHLIVVPTGPLTSLPFQVLLTAPARPGLDPKETVRSAPWLVRRHALSVLPSVPALAALRRARLPLAAAEPFLGIGDPSLTGPPAPAGRQRGALEPAAVYRDGRPDLRALRELVPLPETAAELTAIANALQAPREALLLGSHATETAVRRAPLDRYRVIQFATHGLVAGEMSGLHEPALVLTPPIRPSEEDDGLLTASEVATLRLKADWVVLSACNTAAGAEIGAEALSGLARAFFFAGARALLVSHWAVNSEATVWLTTETFAALVREPAIGRAEAFRRTMLAMIDAGLAPSAWAPFVIVGEGAGAR